MTDSRLQQRQNAGKSRWEQWRSVAEARWQNTKSRSKSIAKWVLLVVGVLIFDGSIRWILWRWFPNLSAQLNKAERGPTFDGRFVALFSVESATAVALWVSTFAVLALSRSHTAVSQARSNSERRAILVIDRLRNFILLVWLILLLMSLLPPFLVALVELMPFASGGLVAISTMVVIILILVLWAFAQSHFEQTDTLLNRFGNDVEVRLERLRRWTPHRVDPATSRRVLLATASVKRLGRGMKMIRNAFAALLPQAPWAIAALAFNMVALFAVGFCPTPTFISVVVLAQLVLGWYLLIRLAIVLFVVEADEESLF